ncbi:RNA polymerase sigma factor [Flagellimonas allohymeniacidonis]|uniref:Sigma-70 family RNA polymerase sigma factor n=1 Tax=Flagellimonas allohymeniacidonis TaxID=2517819 RepID=A0A4Q8QCW8_9FLAO|nr:sigma-70 family RNA polymerase sigma factor [Allomuricauda hymeniacidonis]TAI47337.1 sigma-70 family RNA polymerase sigma factor [Allomuricauda hymeniacidonis]
MTDHELIVQLRNGNENCLKQLYNHMGMVKSWIGQNNGNEEDALDVFQEAIMVFYKNVLADKYEPRGKISTYLFEICKRQWLNQLNRRKKYENRDITFSISDGGQENNTIEITIKGPNLKQYLQSTLEKIGDPCKSILEATIFMGQKMEEIAERFNYSSARSASQQKLRCLQKLREEVSYDVIIRLKPE